MGPRALSASSDRYAAARELRAAGGYQQLTRLWAWSMIISAGLIFLLALGAAAGRDEEGSPAFEVEITQ